MISSGYPAPVFVTTPVRKGNLHHRFLPHPAMKAMVVIPVSVSEHGTGNQLSRFFTESLTRFIIEKGLSCLLTEIVTPEEDADHHLRMDEELHAQRLLFAMTRTEEHLRIPPQPTGLAGVGARGVCCLLAAKRNPERIYAVAGIDLPDYHNRYSADLRIPVRLENPGTACNGNSSERTAYEECAKHLATWFKENLDIRSASSQAIDPKAPRPQHEKTF